MTDTATDDSAARKYDETPYPSAAYPQTHPDHLAVIGTLFGMKPPEVSGCRVLELGCADGGNLVPMAVNLPEAEFVGVDISQRHIATGQQVVDQLNLANIQLVQRSILDLDHSLGSFDYIIAHGVFSWVPEAVQTKLLDICRSLLAPQGIAFVSYNTYPGWRLRQMLRDMMLYHAQRFDSSQQRIQQARALLQFLADVVPSDDSPYGLLLREELEDLRGRGDSYLCHELLEDVNDPIYFHQFARKAETHGLRYLGESEFHTMLVSNLSPNASTTLERLATDQIDMEQYMDFVRNRTFRQTLLCHGDVALDRNVSADRLEGMHVASPLQPTDPQIDVTSDDVAEFVHGPSGSVVSVRRALLKSALVILAEQWPQSLSLGELAGRASKRATDGNGSTISDQDRHGLAEMLLRSFVKNLIALHVHPPRIASSVSRSPLANPLARLQAAANQPVTTQLHDTAQLDNTHCRVLSLLDGTRDSSQLGQTLVEQTLGGDLKLQKDEQSIGDSARIRQLIESEIGPCLKRLAENAILIG